MITIIFLGTLFGGMFVLGMFDYIKRKGNNIHD